MAKHQPFSRKRRNVTKAILALLLLLLLATSSSVPFIWESKTLWYKFGVDRTLLQFGKVAGICAAILLFAQLILVLRISLLDKVFGLDRLYVLHQYNGYLISLLAIVHASLILIPEGIKNLPIGWKFWPEIVGALTLFLLIIIVSSTWLRSRTIPYSIWRNLHRPFGYLIIGAIFIHILYVSDSFENNVPRYGVFLLLLCLISSISILKIKDFLQKKALWNINKITPVSDQVTLLEISCSLPFRHQPGQFAFLSFHGKNISNEPHPFTIASAPNHQSKLQFYIKNSGDWTNNIQTLGQGKPHITGPYGLFSHLCHGKAKRLIFIAGGIGITPMLSMLQQMKDKPESPEVILMWSLPRRSDYFLEEEMNKLQDRIRSFNLHLFFTREPQPQRIDRESIKQLVGKPSPDQSIYLCGPEMMMRDIHALLLGLGHSRKDLHWERFSL